MVLSKLELYKIRDALISIKEDDYGDIDPDVELIEEALEIVEASLINYNNNIG